MLYPVELRAHAWPTLTLAPKSSILKSFKAWSPFERSSTEAAVENWSG
jgi:hypothetical protein